MRRSVAILSAVAALAACDRNLESYVPGEEPEQPDLSRIFPAGVEQAARVDRALEMPPAPDAGGARGTAADAGGARGTAADAGGARGTAADAGGAQGTAADAGGAQGTAPDAAAEAQPIRGTIRVSDELAGRVPEGAVLFLIARRGEGGPPLAVQRIGTPTFPLEFAIGPADRMMQTVPFEGELRLSARLDGDGNAMSRAAGDLQGSAPRAFSPGALGVEIVLDEVL
jgi:hypothetical protein